MNGLVNPHFADLRDKVAVITGGSKGIGRATARLLVDNGSRVAVVARGRGDIEETVAELSAAGGEAIGIAADATSPQGVADVRRRVEAELGAVDILLPYAGGFSSFTPVWETSLDEWEHVLRLNLTSSFLALKEFLPAMVKRERGAVVLMSSVSGRFLDKPTTASYAAAKAGVLMLMRHAAQEAAPRGVRINAIAPATVTSERIQQIMDDEALSRTAALSPLGRIGTPVDCASASAFLASDVSGWMTGVTLDIAGGRVML